MTRVDFYNIPETGSYDRFVCRIAGKAWNEGHDIHVHARTREEAENLDDLFWTYKDISFLPHTLNSDNEAASTPISIGWSGTMPQAKQVLINLCDDIPDFVNSFIRVIEIVAADPPKVFDRAVRRALRRWKFRPIIADGRAVERRARKDIHFKLNEP